MPAPSSSNIVYSRTTVVKNTWEALFELKQPGHVVAHLQISSETNWEEPKRPAVLLEVSIDERLASHLVTYMGREMHPYAVHLGALTAGQHHLGLQRADSSEAALKLREVRIDVYREDHPLYHVFAHAPIIFGRSRQDFPSTATNGKWLDNDMRTSDVPLLLAYEEHPLATGKVLKYTVFFSNENGGTPPAGLLHLWGRYSDIEWAYRVELDASSKRRRGFFQGPEHTSFVYRGGFENNQPTLQVVTLNNMFDDSLTTKLRFALPPLLTMPADGMRESVMLQAPWTWQVGAKEARREQRTKEAQTDSTGVADLRRYLYIQFMAEPESAGVKSGGFFIVRYKNQPNEYPSHLWSNDLIIRGDCTLVRQTAVPLPSDTGPENLLRLDFVAAPEGGGVILTQIARLFSLDENDLPRDWKPSWHGRHQLAPGERLIFFAEDFKLRPAFYLPLAQEWHFKPDSHAVGGATATWQAQSLDQKPWPAIRVGAPWEKQGYADYNGGAWYRYQFQMDNAWQGERLWLGLGGVDDRYQLWINGKLARDYPADSLDADNHFTLTEITPFIQFGKANTLALRVEDFGGEGGLVAQPIGISNFPEVFTHALTPAMADPKLDEEQPFDYFQHPVAMLGMKDYPAVTMVTPEGYLYTGLAEIMFLAGLRLDPLNCRLKTLANEGMPIVRYRTLVDGVEYAFETFAFPASNDSLSPLVTWARVRIQNRSSSSQQVKFALAPRFRDERYRFPAPIAFDPNWHYEVRGRWLLRNGRIISSLPETPFAANFSNPTPLQPETPAGTVEYQWTLGAEESRTLVFCMPNANLSSDEAAALGVLTADFDERLTQATRYWQDLLGNGTQISVPEPKVNAAWQANLAYNLIALDRENGQAVQKVNKFSADYFDLRHAAHVVRMYDLLGYHPIAAEVLRHFQQYQESDGHFASGERRGDGFGPALWALTRHYETTGEMAYAREIYPVVKRAVRWLQLSRRKDPWQLFPAVSARGVNNKASRSVHLTGDNFYALLGLRHAIQLARAIGAPEDISLFTREYEQLQSALLRKLDEATKETGGHIPAILENVGGSNWDYLAVVYPTQVLAPWDEKVSATLAKTRGEFQEGLFTQFDEQWAVHALMNQDLTTYVAEIELRRGEQKSVLEKLYALLTHTSATHAGFYNPMRPWADRDDPVVAPPRLQFLSQSQAGFSTSLVMLVRNMLVREEEREVHLFSAVSPAWMKVGDKISVQNAVTSFGKLSFVAEAMDNRLVIDLSSSWHTPPRNLVLHFPYFTKVERILVAGKKISLQKDFATLSPKAQRVEIFWQNHANRERLGYAAAVENFKREYRERYRVWQAGQLLTTSVPATSQEQQAQKQ